MSFPLKYRLFIALCCFFLGLSNFYAQNIPRGLATPVCSTHTIPKGVPENSGYYDVFPCTSLQGTPFSPYIDFYNVVIQSGSTFTFEVTPSEEVDYDFGAWLNPNYENLNLTNISGKRGSQNDPFITGVFPIGLAMYADAECKAIDGPPGAFGTPPYGGYGTSGEPHPGLVRYFDVEPGDEILIAIDRMSQVESGYTIEFGGDAVLECKIVGNDYYRCIDDGVTTTDFTLDEILPDLIEDFPEANFSFYEILDDAINTTGTPIEFPFTVNYNNGNSTEIYGRVEDNIGNLEFVLRINFHLSKFPELLTTDTIIIDPICDDGNGKAIIHLNRYEDLLVTDEDDNIEVRFYADEDAYENGDFIENPTYYQTENNQIIIAEAINVLSGCTSKDFARLKVNLEQSPTADLSAYDRYVICQDPEGMLDEELTSVEVETGLSNADYEFTWLYEGDTLINSEPNLLISTGGDYSVVIANKGGIFCEQVVDFTIYEWGAPEFKVKSTRQSFVKGNGILVYDIIGSGVYVFKVDDGDWQYPDADGRLEFENIAPGPHLVYGKAVGGCGELVLPITILGYPDFFTPNEDGINDTWNVIGLENQPDAKISIFDRYGKLLKQITPEHVGWDGTFHGKNMPSNEYWFKIEFKETLIIEDGQEIKQPTIHTGHFTLKR